MNKTIDQIKEKIISLRVDQRLSLGDIAKICNIGKTTCARILKKYPLSGTERKSAWANKVKGKPRIPGSLSKTKYERLTPLRWLACEGHNDMWECQCDCGVIKRVRKYALENGTIRSCGCLARELTSKRCFKDPIETGFRVLVAGYKNSAIIRKLDFSLSDEDLKKLFKGSCYYCGIGPLQKRCAGRNKTGYLYNGIDRKDNEIGYTIDNCISCCKICNFAKRDFSYSGFLEWITRIIKYRGVKNGT